MSPHQSSRRRRVNGDKPRKHHVTAKNKNEGQARQHKHSHPLLAARCTRRAEAGSCLVRGPSHTSGMPGLLAPLLDTYDLEGFPERSRRRVQQGFNINIKRQNVSLRGCGPQDRFACWAAVAAHQNDKIRDINQNDYFCRVDSFPCLIATGDADAKNSGMRTNNTSGH